MSDKNSGPEEAVKGVVEGVKGKAKEVVGAVVGRDDVYREGQAQQDKAEAQRNAAKKEAEAESARAAAQAAEEWHRDTPAACRCRSPNCSSTSPSLPTRLRGSQRAVTRSMTVGEWGLNARFKF